RAGRVRAPAPAPRVPPGPGAPSTGRRRSRACATLSPTTRGRRNPHERSAHMLEAAELGNVATRLLFENERVKVWEMRLEPGESSDLHRHTLDYLLYILEGASIDADRPDGESLRFPVEPGQLFFVPRGGPSAPSTGAGRAFASCWSS